VEYTPHPAIKGLTLALPPENQTVKFL